MSKVEVASWFARSPKCK